MIKIHFAKHLGKKILCGGKEYILYGVTMNHLLGLNGSTEPVPLSFDESKMIFNDEIEFGSKQIPYELAVYRTDDFYINVSRVQEDSDDEKELKILEIICECAGITPEELRSNTKTRNRNYVQARQIHMTVRHLFTQRNESLEITGRVYGKNHATVLHSKKVVQRAVDGYDIPFRNKYMKVWKTLKYKYPTLHKKLIKGDWL